MLCCSLPAWVADTNGARCWRVHTAGLERRRGRWVVFRRWFAAHLPRRCMYFTVIIHHFTVVSVYC